MNFFITTDDDMNSTKNSGIINHEGIVQRIEDTSVIVSISSSTACSGCHAEGSCNMAGKEEKIIEVTGRYDVLPGDRVTILMKQSMGYAALLLGYLLPLVSVVTVLIVLVALEVPELPAGLLSLGILIPYYIILFFFRRRVNEKFTFTLKV
ncbi:MAG: SoxR reducing system RseC family protein [Bacteroidales bacterium]|nr:SoxR reducing system RseC family protein [Bacteroidales bacterium]MBK7627437.1 SoxR reducing system RseC family protein [Bacteroidales bacterium]